jgi:hypothetical protein
MQKPECHGSSYAYMAEFAERQKHAQVSAKIRPSDRSTTQKDK